MDDIQEKTFSIAAGTEIPLGESSVVLPDPLYEYISYAPTDWFEFGLAGRYTIGLVGVDVKFDFVDMFTDGSPLSMMLIGGALFFTGGGSAVVGHAGVAANYQVTSWLELYGGAATSTIFLVPVFQVGASISPVKWFSLSANLKLVLNTVESETETEPLVALVSIAPSFNFGP